MRCRGPDEFGTWNDPECGVVLGHRRLAIIDLSPRGRQPMSCIAGDCVVVFNGEIYNFRELRDELLGQGAVFQSRSDTEVLLEGYRHWGDEVVNRLVGTFAFALWDVRRQRFFSRAIAAVKSPCIILRILAGLRSPPSCLRSSRWTKWIFPSIG